MGQSQLLCGGHGDSPSCHALEGIPCAALLFDQHGKLLASNSRADDLHLGGYGSGTRCGWVAPQRQGGEALTSWPQPVADPLGCVVVCPGIDKSLCTFEMFATSVEVCGAALSAGEVLEALLRDTTCIQ